MSSARRCDICGEFYETPEIEIGSFDPWKNTSMIRLLRFIPDKHCDPHEVIHFDACEKCLQNVLDYILTRKADAT